MFNPFQRFGAWRCQRSVHDPKWRQRRGYMTTGGYEKKYEPDRSYSSSWGYTAYEVRERQEYCSRCYEVLIPWWLHKKNGITSLTMDTERHDEMTDNGEVWFTYSNVKREVQDEGVMDAELDKAN